MQFKTFAATLFIACAAALPGASTDSTDAQAANPDLAMTSTFEPATVARSTKTWQADGHCEFKYYKLENCVVRCIYESLFGPARCPSFQSIRANRTGGCLPLRDTCECSCAY
ncbi:hypothetical protein PspLS_10490 [Pyricularia sp. CBS 133598]|nr:hypothetical protein PspLS_10490 [Pyricularia sp. CBS 133598]